MKKRWNTIHPDLNWIASEVTIYLKLHFRENNDPWVLKTAVFIGNDSPGQYQHFEWWRKSVWQWGPEFYNDWEGDSVGKPSNTTETANRYRRSEPKDTAGAQNFLGACTKVTRERSSQNLLGYMYILRLKSDSKLVLKRVYLWYTVCHCCTLAWTCICDIKYASVAL